MHADHGRRVTVRGVRWGGDPPGAATEAAGVLYKTNIRHEVSNIRHEVSNIRHEVSNIRHEVSNIRHEVSNTCSELVRKR